MVQQKQPSRGQEAATGLSGEVRREPASFRDPSGFVFLTESGLYRQVNECYRAEYTRLMKSGLYADLVSTGLLLEHEETDLPGCGPDAYKVIRPRRVPFVSYPYEWCSGQLKAAAELTLNIQRRALEYGMSLKDASAYNIQFIGARPVFIDTLSFETYPEGQPWVAYRQFCQHFLAPLALSAYAGHLLSPTLRLYLDGVPLPVASVLLPLRTRLKVGLFTHLHLHAKAQRRFSDRRERVPGKVSLMGLRGMIESLGTTIRRLKDRASDQAWRDYYEGTSYTGEGLEHKRDMVGRFLDRVVPTPTLVWDFGANTGLHSQTCTEKGFYTVAFDSDPACVEKAFQDGRRDQSSHLLPLVMDLSNPSPALGWAHSERGSLVGRGPADVLLALALVHHLAIANNTPLPQIADFFAQCGRWLITEFVPKTDPQTQRLLANRRDVFPDYTQESFEQSFNRCFVIHESVVVKQSDRVLYLMERRISGTNTQLAPWKTSDREAGRQGRGLSEPTSLRHAWRLFA